MARWDVYRDERGRAVKLTRKQTRAVIHALYIVDEVRKAEGYPALSEGAGVVTNAWKSRLLGRMLIYGKAPLDEKPDVFEWGARVYPDGKYDT